LIGVSASKDFSGEIKHKYFEYYGYDDEDLSVKEGPIKQVPLELE